MTSRIVIINYTALYKQFNFCICTFAGDYFTVMNIIFLVCHFIKRDSKGAQNTFFNTTMDNSVIQKVYANHYLAGAPRRQGRVTATSSSTSNRAPPTSPDTTAANTLVELDIPVNSRFSV